VSEQQSGHVFYSYIHDPSQQAVETVNGDLARNSQMCQVLIDVDKDIATEKRNMKISFEYVKWLVFIAD
jgi:hypothetical protein